MNKLICEKLDWEKMDGLIPAVVQNVYTMQVLMLGYMTQEALIETIKTKKIVFYSRSRQCLWRKGDTSGNSLNLVDIRPDCDKDSIMLLVIPNGPTCHLGNQSCFGDFPMFDFIKRLELTIDQRYRERPSDSYTAKLFNLGVERISQKVGEEAVELVLASMGRSKKNIINEAADLIYHVLVLLRMKGLTFKDVVSELHSRHVK